MVLSKCDSIRELHSDKRSWKIKVRVLATWRGKPVSDTEPGGLNLMLIDDGNTRIHAFITPAICKGMTVDMVEGGLYMITNFSVKKSNNSQGPDFVRNPRHIFFEEDTFVQPVEYDDQLIPKMHFDIISYDAVEALASDRSYLVDLIGVVENIIPPNQVSGKKSFVSFFINNGRDSLKVKLWDPLCKEFTEVVKGKLEVPIIIVLACCKPNLWQGELSVTNTSATRMYVNPNHYTAEKLRQRLVNIPQSHFDNVEVGLKCFNEIQVCQLQEFFEKQPNEQAMCTLTLGKLPLQKDWILSLCSRCQQPVKKSGGIYTCLHCNRKIPLPDRRFRILTAASDGSGTVPLILRDREVRIMTNKSALDLDIDSDDEFDEDPLPVPFPPEISLIEQTTFNFRIMTCQGYGNSGDPVYEASFVSNVSDDSLKKHNTTEDQGQSEVDTTLSTEAPINCETETTPKKRRKATPLTRKSSTKTLVRKKKNIAPIEMDEDLPLTQFKVPKKERK